MGRGMGFLVPNHQILCKVISVPIIKIKGINLIRIIKISQLLNHQYISCRIYKVERIILNKVLLIIKSTKRETKIIKTIILALITNNKLKK
jgi:hypothetical protein